MKVKGSSAYCNSAVRRKNQRQNCTESKTRNQAKKKKKKEFERECLKGIGHAIYCYYIVQVVN